jgi:hypothetical protein
VKESRRGGLNTKDGKKICKLKRRIETRVVTDDLSHSATGHNERETRTVKKKEYHTLTLEIKYQERDSSGIPTTEGRPGGRKNRKEKKKQAENSRP